MMNRMKKTFSRICGPKKSWGMNVILDLHSGVFSSQNQQCRSHKRKEAMRKRRAPAQAKKKGGCGDPNKRKLHNGVCGSVGFPMCFSYLWGSFDDRWPVLEDDLDLRESPSVNSIAAPATGLLSPRRVDDRRRLLDHVYCKTPQSWS